jgi:hypothetical protein
VVQMRVLMKVAAGLVPPEKLSSWNSPEGVVSRFMLLSTQMSTTLSILELGMAESRREEKEQETAAAGQSSASPPPTPTPSLASRGGASAIASPSGSAIQSRPSAKRIEPQAAKTPDPRRLR